MTLGSHEGNPNQQRNHIHSILLALKIQVGMPGYEAAIACLVAANIPMYYMV
jgi:hypothetical protein